MVSEAKHNATNGEGPKILTHNSKTSHPHRSILTDKIDLPRGAKNVALSNLSIYYTWKNKKGYITTINSKYSQREMINLNYWTD